MQDVSENHRALVLAAADREALFALMSRIQMSKPLQLTWPAQIAGVFGPLRPAEATAFQLEFRTASFCPGPCEAC